MIHFVGDVHGLFIEYQELLEHLPASDPVFQLGDMGIGFGRDHLFPAMPQRFFIRGNHDNPKKCKMTPGCLDDFGYLEDLGLFFISGAYSVDHVYRTEGQNWWPDEELSREQFGKAIDLYERVKPRIVISHDCPYEVLESIAGQPFRTTTTSALSMMFAAHEPELWVFGHHHKTIQFKMDNTVFQALGELKVFSFDETANVCN